MEKTHYRRALPHMQPSNGVFNICFRLADTLPIEIWHHLKNERDRKITELENSNESPESIKSAIQKERANYFGKYDAMLDSGEFGPTFLKSPEIAQIVFDCFIYWHEQKRFKLICLCIMPNHVHVILYKIQKPLFRILQTIKIYSAKKSNLLLNRTGQPFWHPESYDNLVRDKHDLLIKIQYILNNPVKAKHVKNWDEWKFTWLNPEFQSYAPSRNTDC